MANKYIRHGETYCGDGLGSAAAASDNEANTAWNDINILTGTAPGNGSVAAGDVIYIRSKDAGGNDLALTSTATFTLGSAAATAASPISWILDDGDVWSGIDGTLTFTCTGSYVLTSRDYNRYYSRTYKAWKVVSSTSTGYTGYLASAKYIVCDGLHFDFSGFTGTSGPALSLDRDVTLSSVAITANKPNVQLISAGGYGQSLFINLDIELLTPTPVFTFGPSLACAIRGGRIYGAGTASGSSLFKYSGYNQAHITVVGLQYPKQMALYSSYSAVQQGASVALSEGFSGGSVSTREGLIESRADVYFPTLDATIPETGDGWSYRIAPYNVNFIGPISLSLMKAYVATADRLTLTVECLVEEDFDAYINANTLYLSVGYTEDSTGAFKTLSTFAKSACLQSSSANWSSTTYGSSLFIKRKLTIDLPTDVKQYTLVNATVFLTQKQTASTDSIFVCPDFVLSAT